MWVYLVIFLSFSRYPFKYILSIGASKEFPQWQLVPQCPLIFQMYSFFSLVLSSSLSLSLLGLDIFSPALLCSVHLSWASVGLFPFSISCKVLSFYETMGTPGRLVPGGWGEGGVDTFTFVRVARDSTVSHQSAQVISKAECVCLRAACFKAFVFRAWIWIESHYCSFFKQMTLPYIRIEPVDPSMTHLWPLKFN